MRIHSRCSRGFTLIELVVVIAISGVLVAASAALIVAPINLQRDQQRRALLTADADAALRALQLDLRSAVPGSVRVSAMPGGATLEMLQSRGSALLRTGDTSVTAAWNLDAGVPDPAFSTLNELPGLVRPLVASMQSLLVFDPALGADAAYDAAGALTPLGTSVSIIAGPALGQDLITLSPAFTFSALGATPVLHLVTGPVAWVCDTGTRRLLRIAGYAVDPDRSRRDSVAELVAAGGSGAVMATDVSACAFATGAPAANGTEVVTFSLSVQRAGEQITLAGQQLLQVLL